MLHVFLTNCCNLSMRSAISTLELIWKISMSTTQQRKPIATVGTRKFSPSLSMLNSSALSPLLKGWKKNNFDKNVLCWPMFEVAVQIKTVTYTQLSVSEFCSWLMFFTALWYKFSIVVVSEMNLSWKLESDNAHNDTKTLIENLKSNCWLKGINKRNCLIREFLKFLI